MPRLFCLIGLLCVMAYSTQAALVGHFKFDGSLDDETGNHHGAMREPLETPLYSPGVSGDALDIDSPGNSVECANPTSFEMSHDFSIAVWVKTSKEGEVLVVYKGPRDAYAAKSRQFELYGGGGLGGNGLFLHTGDSGAYGTSFEESHGITVNDNEWHHVALTYSASVAPHVTLYMDGIPKVGSDPGQFFNTDLVMNPDGTDENQVLRIGGRDEQGAYTTFVGLMDDVQLYDRPLTAEQVQFLVDNPGESIAPPELPVIYTQPTAIQIVGEGTTNVTFFVEAEGAAPLSYQWQFNGADLPGQTSATLTLSDVTSNDLGDYAVLVTNPGGSLMSDTGHLVVLAGGLATVDLHMYAGITLLGLPAATYDIQSAEVVGQTTNWTTVRTVTLPDPSTPYVYIDLDSANVPATYYRAVLVP